MSLAQLALGLVSGIGLGSIYVLIGISFTIVLQASGIFNLLLGLLLSLGTVFAFVFGVSWGFPFLLTAVATLVLGGVIGLATYGVAIWPLAGRTEHLGELGMVTTLGLAAAAQVLVNKRFGVDPRGVPNYVTSEPIRVSDSISIQPIYLVMTLVAVVLVVIMGLTLSKTGAGRIMRATLEDPEGAALAGIDTRKVVAIVLCVSGALAMFAGLMLSPLVFASPYSGRTIMLIAFVAMGIGGFGSVKGVVVGGLTVGLIQAFVPIWTTPNATVPILLGLAIVVLTLRPVGLFGAMGTMGNRRHREV